MKSKAKLIRTPPIRYRQFRCAKWYQDRWTSACQLRKCQA